MNEHGGHIHYPAFLGNSPVTTDDLRTITAYAGRRPDVLNKPQLIGVAVVNARIISMNAIDRIQQESR